MNTSKIGKFAVQDIYTGDYWSGEEWVTDKTDAFVYDTVGEALKADCGNAITEVVNLDDEE